MDAGNGFSVSKLVVCSIVIVIKTGLLPVESRSYLPVISKGSSCLVGTYTRIVDTRCHSALDSNSSAYTPPFLSGWMVVTMPTVALVSYVGLLYRTFADDQLEFTLHLPAEGGEALGSLHLSSSPSGTYYAPFFVDPIITNSFTLTWKTFKPFDILDIRVIGKTEGMERIVPESIHCDNLQERQCPNIIDNNILTTLFLVSGTTLRLKFSAGKAISHVALYSHQLQTRASHITARLTFTQINGTYTEIVEVALRNQGWEHAGRWQIVALPKNFPLPLTLTVATANGAYATLSEMQFFYAERVPNITARVVPPFRYDVPFVHTLEAERVSQVRTSKGRYTNRKLPVKEEELTSSRPDDVTTADGAATTSYTTTADVLVSARTPLPRWLVSFAAILAIAVVADVIVVVAVAAVRVRHRRYAPNERRRLSIRNADNEIPTASVVTPTRGYFHLTLNSQSSTLEPYNGVSPLNTTTFAQNASPPLVDDAHKSDKMATDGTDTSRF